MKIKVVQMVYSDCLKPGNWFEYVEKINRIYCKIHGYEYIVDRVESPRTDRHGNWMKVDTIRDNLYDCDYLLSLEDDCAFYRHSLAIFGAAKDETAFERTFRGSEHIKMLTGHFERLQDSQSYFIRHYITDHRNRNPDCFKQLWESPLMRRNELLLNAKREHLTQKLG